MKKLISAILFIPIIVISAFTLIDINVNAQSPSYEVYLTVEGSADESFSTRSELEAFYDSAYGEIGFTVNVRSLTGSDINLTSLDFSLDTEGPFGEITFVESRMVGSGRDLREKWSISNNASFMSFVWDSTDTMNETITPTGTELGSVYIAYDISNTATEFSLGLIYSDASFYETAIPTTIFESEMSMQSLNIGSPSAEPTAELSNLQILGDSGAEYFNGVPLESPDSTSITISYQDSLSRLTINTLQVSPSASIMKSSNSLPYTDGDVITLTVTDTDGTTTATKEYIININVVPAKTLNDLSDLTINKGNISPAFNSSVTEYTVNLNYSESDLRLTAAVNPDDLSSLNSTEYDETFPVGTTIREFIVTAEDGTTKTYTVNVIRAVASTDLSVSDVYVDGNIVTSADGTSYNYTLDELDSNFNFKVITSDEYAEIDYKLSTDTSYTNIFSNTNSPSFAIENNESFTYDIRVTAQDGSDFIYQLEVFREASTATDLTKVEVVEGFSTNTLASLGGIYEYVLSNTGQTEITINTEIVDYATVTILDPLGNEVINGQIAIDALSEDTHQFVIVVTAQDGVTEETYQLNIIKKSSAKDIVNIKAENIDDGYTEFTFTGDDFTFDSATNTYMFKFDFEYDNIRFVVDSSPLSTITGSATYISTTNNQGYFDVTLTSTSQNVTLNVEAEDGSTKQYTVTFRKRAADSTNTLDDLKVDGMTIDGFNPTKFSNYNRIILPGDTTSVYVEGIINGDVNSTITYNGLASKQISLVRGEVKTVNIKVTAEDGSYNTYTIEIVAANENNAIDNIIFNNVNFTFNPLTTEYNFSVDYIYNSTDITVITPTGAESVVFGDGSKVLNEGVNTFKVYAESEAGIEGTEYTFNITRDPARSYKQLESLSVGTASLVPEFLSGVYTYDVRVDESITEVLISATVPDDNGSSIISGTGTVSLQSGQTKSINIVVQAEDGTKQTYTVNILRANDINTFDKVTIDGIDYLPSDFNASNELILPDQAFSNKEIIITVHKTDSFSTTTISPAVTVDNEWLLSEGENTLIFYVTSQAGTKGVSYKIITTQTSPNTNNDLDYLEVLLDGNNLLTGDNAFSKDKFNYSIRVDNDTTGITINASVLSEYRSSITGDIGNTTLSFVTKIYTVTVTAEDGSTQDYNIEVTRQNNNNTITDINFNGFTSVVYDENTYTYDLGEVAYSVESLDLSVILEDESASIYVNNKLVSQSSTVNLVEGINTIEIYAKSEYGTNGNVYTYTIERNLAQTKAELKDLEILAGGIDLLVDDLVFDPATSTYEIRVDRSVASININASVNPADQSVITGDTGSNPLVAGENIFRVTVTAEDGVNKNTYLINITRANDNNNITDITVDGSSIGFDSITNSYVLDDVDFTVEDIDIQVILEDTYATVNLDGLQTLVDGSNVFEIYATSEYGTKGTVYSITVFKQAANTGNLLESLELMVDGVNVLTGAQAFIDTLNNYEVRVDNNISEVIINAIAPSSDRSTVTGTGLKTLSNSTQILTVTVTAENGDVNQYNITIVRQNDNNTITDINFNGFTSVVYDENTYTYDLGEVAYSVESLDLSVILEDESASIYVNNKLVSQSSTVNLVEGINTIEIYAKSEYGTVGSTYTYTITRNAAQTKAELKDLEILAGGIDLLVDDLVFDPATSTYEIRVDRSVASININASVNPADQSVITGDTGSNPLVAGENIFRVTVTAEDGVNKNTYLINITRANDNNNITDITVDGNDISFDSNTSEYNLPNVDFTVSSIDFEVLLEDTYATVNLEGVQTLVDGLNTFTIKATSEFGTVGQTYTFTIFKQSANTGNLLDDLELMVDGVNVLTGDQAFIATKNNYEIRINNDISEVMINASLPSGDRSTVTGTGLKTLSTATQTLAVTVTAENGDENTYNITIVRKNDNNAITDINFNGFTSVVYDENTYTYDLGEVAYSVESLDLSVILEDESASIYVNNKLVSQSSTVNLVEGINTIEIYAKSEYGTNGNVYTYTIERNLAQTKAELKDLEILAGGIDLLVDDLVFDPATSTYEIRVDRSVASININASVNPADQSVITGDTGSNPLVAGENIFRVTVTAEDGVNKNTYLINITRANDNNNITDITVDGSSIGFDSLTNSYVLDDVDFTVEDIDIQVILEDTYATVNLDGLQTLVDGSNVFEIYATSEYGTKGTVYSITVFKQAANTGNLLESLELMVDGVNVLTGAQAFIDTLNNYEVRVDNNISEVIINAIAPSSDRSTVTGTGLKTLSNSTQILTVTVTAENGDVNQYNITIVRQNDNNTITDINFNGFTSVVYDENTYTYDLGEVAYSVESLDLSVILEDESASIYVNNKLVSQSSTVNLVEGINTIEIYAKSEYGTVGSTYTYTITRNAAQTDADLSDLEVLVGTEDLLVGDMTFNPNTSTYTLRVNRDINSIIINAYLDPSLQATLSGDTGSRPLSLGANSFRITVTAEDGVTKNTYLIEVTKANDNNNITDITVDGETIGFNPATYEYVLDSVTYDVTEIDLSVLLEDAFSSVNINGVQTLSEGINIFEIYATSEYGTVGEIYTITIEKLPASSANLLNDLQLLVNGVDILVDDSSFDPLINIYNLRVDNDVTQIEILADVLESDRSTLTSGQLGVKNLIAGTNNSFKVTVIAEDGTENIYEINISSENNNFNISDIIVDGFESVVFDSVLINYNLGNVTYSNKSIDFSVILEDSSATIRINGQITSETSNHILKPGLNTFVIQVESQYGEFGDEYTYTVTQEPPMTNADLLDLEVLVGGNNLLVDDILFDSETLIYELRVDRSVESVNILAYLDGQYNSTYNGDTGSKPLSIGENTFNIHVTAEDKTTLKTYRVIIHRNNDDSSITDIKIDGVTLPGFDSSTISYQMIPYEFDVNSVLITATTNDANATVYGTGTINLIDGVLTVEVYAESDYGTKGQIYTIELERKVAFSDTALSALIVYDDLNNPLTFEEGIYNKNITGYTIKLDSESLLTEINIEALLLNSEKQIITGHTGVQVLTVKADGTINQTFSVTVEAESGNQQTYSITVLKGTNLSSDASINRVTLTDTSGNSLLTFNALEAIQDDVILNYQTSIINLNVIPNDQNATVVGNGTFTINADQTATLKFKVIAQDGTTESLEYTINVYRQAPSSDNTLSSLEVLNNGIDLLIENNQFSSTKYTYTLKVNRSVEVLDIRAIADHSGATITGDVNQVLLVPGVQQLKIYVSAEDGSQKTYYINVEVVNSNIEIISLSVDSFDIEYDQLTETYDLGEISSSFDTLNIKAIIPGDSFGTLSGDLGEVNLGYGLNFFTVTATSEDGSESVSYTIFANRLEPDGNNYLSDLYVTDGTYRLPFSDAVFNKETNFYQIILDKTSKVEAIEIFATTENGTVPSGTGRHLLSSIAGVIHNDFYVTVTADNGDERIYQIQVIKADSSDLSSDTEIKDLTISTSENDYEVLFDGDIIKQEPIMLDYKESSFFVDISAGERATVYGNTLYKLQPGETKTVEFHVEAENGDLSPVYSIEVTRPLPNSNNVPSRLYVLIDGEIIELDVNENYHVIDIPDNIGSLGIEAEITDSQYIMGTGTKTIAKDNQKFYVIVTAEDGTPNAYTIEVDQKSDNATIKSIMINGVEMFGHFKGNYITLDEVLFETDTLNVLATSSHPNATITGDGELTLNIGRNIIEIFATSELGTKGDVYTIEITRGQASSDATLSDLIVKDNQTGDIITYTPSFDSARLRYTIALTMEDNIQEILIDATANNAYIQSIEGEGIYTLKTASAETTEIFTVKVVAEDGSIIRYEIHVTRAVDPEDDVTIDSLSLFGESLNYLGTNEAALNAFTMSQTEYSITVPYALNNLYLSVTNLNGASVVGGGTYQLNEETTVIEFNLTSKSGNVIGNTYTITVTKEQASSDHSLEGIYIDGDLIDGFDPETYIYELVVSYEDVSSIHVEAGANHPQANVIGDLGDVELQAGTNTINIRVVAEDGSLVTYKLLVSRLSTDADLDDLFVYDYDLNYTFEQGRIRYELTVPYTTTYIEIGAVANPLANIMNTGIQYLEVGENTYEVYAISESGLKGTVYELHITRQEVSDDSTLKSLTIRDAKTNDIIQYGPEFKPETTEYIIILDENTTVDSLMIEGIANDEFASVGGNGYKVLKAIIDGKYHNIFEVTVRAQDLSTTTYTISVYKDVDLSNSTQMNQVSLTGSNGEVYLGTENASIQFSPNTYYYEVTVPYDVNSMTLNINTETATAYGIGTKTFTNNIIQFEAYVVSQSGQNYTEDYVIVINREEAVVENQLKNIFVNGDTIDGFDSQKSYYEIDIPYLSTDKVIISGEALDSSSRITGDIGTHDLVEGKNVYQLNVTAQNGEVKSYTVAINYLNANAYLEELQVINPLTEKSYPFTFNPDTFEYTINIGKNDEEVILAGRAQDQNSAAIIGLGRYQVSNHGNTAVINVIASDNKTTLSYTVNIVREELPSNNSKLKTLSVGGQNLAFNPDTLQYELSVDEKISDLDIMAETDCPDAVYRISGQDDISVGKNVVLIEVQAEDGTQSIYQLAVHRDAQPDNFLTMLLIVSLLVWIITVLVILIKSQRERRHYRKSIIK